MMHEQIHVNFVCYKPYDAIYKRTRFEIAEIPKMRISGFPF